MKSLIFFLRVLRPGLLALLLMMACVRPAAAVSCNVGTSTNMNFGSIDVLSGGVVSAAAAEAITYGCNADPGTTILVCVSIGADPTTHGYDPRYLILDGSGGSSRLAYNLYSDVARTAIWGAVGAPGSYAPVPTTMTFGSGEYYKSVSLTVYGGIKTSGQSGVAAGYYSTNTAGPPTVSINYKAYSGAVPSCSSGGMATASSSGFYTNAQVTSDCRLVSSSNMDFGTVFQTLTQNVDTTGAIVVTCNGGQSGNGYHVWLGDGLHPVSSGGQRRMQGPNGALLNYELYKDAARTTRWGNSDYLGVAGTGNGQPQTLAVYGRVPPQTVPAAGKYTDTVVITVSY